MPLVVRLEGTNVELGKKILARVRPHDHRRPTNLADAAEKIVAAVQGGKLMAILVDKNTKVICQGITGSAGHLPLRAGDRLRHQDGRRRDAGQGRHDAISSLPVFDTVAEAVAKTGANATVIYVPPPFAADAILEAVDAGRR